MDLGTAWTRLTPSGKAVVGLYVFLLAVVCTDVAMGLGGAVWRRWRVRRALRQAHTRAYREHRATGRLQDDLAKRLARRRAEHGVDDVA